LLAVPVKGDDIHRALWDFPKQDIPEAKRLLEIDPRLVHSRDDYQHTPLHIAARFGPFEMVELLLQLKSDVNAIALNGFTPMHMVSDSKIAKRLIDAGANLDQEDGWGTTPLQYALLEDRKAVVDAILSSGYQLDLTSAVLLRKRDLAMQMVKKNPNLIKITKVGKSLGGAHTPLAIAAGQGDVELVKFFLDAGADIEGGTIMVNAGSMATALTNAVWADKAEVVELLIKHGARTDAGGGKFYPTVLDVARARASKKVVDLLENAPPPKAEAPSQSHDGDTDQSSQRSLWKIAALLLGTTIAVFFGVRFLSRFFVAKHSG
jgi:tankyrase